MIVRASGRAPDDRRPLGKAVMRSNEPEDGEAGNERGREVRERAFSRRLCRLCLTCCGVCSRLCPPPRNTYEYEYEHGAGHAHCAPACYVERKQKQKQARKQARKIAPGYSGAVLYDAVLVRRPQSPADPQSVRHIVPGRRGTLHRDNRGGSSGWTDAVRDVRNSMQGRERKRKCGKNTKKTGTAPSVKPTSSRQCRLPTTVESTLDHTHRKQITGAATKESRMRLRPASARDSRLWVLRPQ